MEDLSKIVKIEYTSKWEEAEELSKKGYEPVECAFGDKSVVGKFVLDHHGRYSNEDAVSVKAAKLAIEGKRHHEFVVTGTPDCDQIYAIAALSGLIPISMDDAEAIAEIDVDPIGRDKTLERYLPILMFEQRTQGLLNCRESSYTALGELVRIFNREYHSSDIDEAIKKETFRIRDMMKKLEYTNRGKIGLAVSEVRGFAEWYKDSSIVVQYDPKRKKITIGLCPKKNYSHCKTSGIDLLGPKGLEMILPVLNKMIMEGFGGKRDIIGSPRDVEMTYEQAKQIYDDIIPGMISMIYITNTVNMDYTANMITIGSGKVELK